jgi:hypothetical protein
MQPTFKMNVIGGACVRMSPVVLMSIVEKFSVMVVVSFGFRHQPLVRKAGQLTYRHCYIFVFWSNITP